MSGNLERIEKIYAAFSAGDINAVLAGFADDIIWREAESFPYADGNPYRGPGAVAQGVFQRLGAEWNGWRADIEAIHDAGETVIARGRYKASNKATGRDIDAQFVHVWRLADGRVSEFQQYADTLQVAEAMRRQ